MLERLFAFFFGRNLEYALNRTKRVRVQGVRFTIKRIDVQSYLDGSSVMVQKYAEYQVGKTKEAEPSEKKARQHLAEVLVAGVVVPKLVHKKEQEEAGEGFWVQNLFADPDMVSALYQEIMALTYGKKKVRQYFSRQRSSEKSTPSATDTASARAST